MTSSSSSSQGVRILYVGGCQVKGYPVGEKYAFPNGVACHLESGGVVCVTEAVPYVPLHHPEKAVDACRRFRPDILVLQLGTWELGKELGSYLLSRLGFQVKKRSSSSKEAPQMAHAPRYTLKARAKQWIDQALGHPLIDFAEYAAKFRTFLAAVEPCAGQVLVLAPIPAADFTAQHYRLLADPIVRAAVAERHFTYVDVLSGCPGLEERVMGPDRFFADAIHLGIAGHAAISRQLAIQITKVLQLEPIQH